MAEKAEWMSIGDAAKFLGVSRDTLRRWEKRGKIKPVRSPTNRRYYTKKHLEEVMAGKFDSKETSAPSPSKKKAVKSGSKSKGVPMTLIFGLISFVITAIVAGIVFFFIL